MVALATSTDSPALQAAREGAFLQLEPPAFRGVPDRLIDPAGRPFGPPLVKLSPWRHHLLSGYRSPYVTGGTCSRDHLLQALYLCSPSYRGGSRLAYILFRVRWAWWSVRYFRPANEALVAWLEAPFALQPSVPREISSNDGPGLPELDYHWLADRMLLARQLGLDPVQALHLPYAVLWPMLGHTIGGEQPGRPRFNRKRDQQIKRYLEAKKGASTS